MSVDHAAITDAITDAEALGVTWGQLLALARTALADALKNGLSESQISLPTGLSYTLPIDTIRGLAERAAQLAQGEDSGGIYLVPAEFGL